MANTLNAKITSDNLTCYADHVSVNLRYYICADCLRTDAGDVYSASVFDIDAGGDRVEYLICSCKEEALLNYCFLVEAYNRKK